MRSARHQDLDYFVQAGAAFCERAPYNFDAESYAEMVTALIDDPLVISVVDGDPARCHSVARLLPSFYDARETIAHVFTTWGPGGLSCFREVERLAKLAGARYLIADQMYDPRIGSFYRRRGMSNGDSLFIKEL